MVVCIVGVIMIIVVDIVLLWFVLVFEFGVMYVFNSWEVDIVDVICEIIGGGVDYVFELIGLLVVLL